MVFLKKNIDQIHNQVPPEGQATPLNKTMTVVKSKINFREAKGLLARIVPNDYDTWFQGGCAMKNLGFGEEDFVAWSRKSEKFDEAECRQKWRDLPDEPRAGISTLRRYASGEAVEAQEITFVAPPAELLPPPENDEDCTRQAAQFVLSMFRPGEFFELCGSFKKGERYIPARDSQFCCTENDTVESVITDAQLAKMRSLERHGVYIALNPSRKMREDQKAVSDNLITDCRLALLESDDLPVEQQWRLISQMRLPVCAVVFSGNKSLHVLCRIDAGNDLSLYHARVAELYAYAERHGFRPDTACKNPSRLTRCPGFVRDTNEQVLMTGAWGYPDWASFAAAELPVNDTMPAAAAQNEVESKMDLSAAFAVNSRGGVTVNQAEFAKTVVSMQEIRFVDGYYWRYAENTGLWRVLSIQELNNLMVLTLDVCGKSLGMELAHLCTQNLCQAVRGFIVPEETNPFSDRPRNIIHVKNGMVEVGKDGTLSLRSFAPEFHSRNRCEIEFDPNAECPRFLHDLLELMFQPEDIELLQFYAGQCLLGDNFTQTILLLTGTAGGGKGTVVNLIKNIIGKTNCTQLRTKYLGDRFEVGRYVGKTLLLGADVPPQFLQEKSAGVLKSLCGGDPLSAELKGVQGGIALEGRFNIIITANSKPRLRVDNDADAWKRRILWIHLTRPRTATPIPDFDQQLLREEGPGILRWMIEGASKIVCAGRVPLYAEAANRIEMLLRDSDSVYGFLRSQVETSSEPHTVLSSEDLYHRYEAWCRDNDLSEPDYYYAKSRLKHGMEDLFHLTQSNDIPRGMTHVRGYHGVRFKQEEESVVAAPQPSVAVNEVVTPQIVQSQRAAPRLTLPILPFPPESDGLQQGELF